MGISAKLGMWWRRVDGTLRKQLMIRRPNDVFVAEMLRHLAEKYNAAQCADLKVKVAHCATLDGWMEVWSLAKLGLDCDRLRTEYGEALRMEILDDWRNVNCLLLQVAVQDTSTGKIAFADENQKEQIMVEHGLRAEVANALSPFDAIIFVNDSNVKQAFRAGQPFPLHLVLTHECINLIERRTGQTIIKDFDPSHKYYDDPSGEALVHFIDKIGQNEFARRYLTKP